MPDPLEIIRRECALLKEFIGILGEEEQALVAADTEALGTVTPRKTGLVAQLNQLAELRNQAMRSMGLAIDTAGLEAWRQQSAESERVVGELIGLASTARERNRINGQLIALHLQKTQEALQALTGGDPGRQTYGRDGQAEPTRTGYRLIDSA